MKTIVEEKSADHIDLDEKPDLPSNINKNRASWKRIGDDEVLLFENETESRHNKLNDDQIRTNV